MSRAKIDTIINELRDERYRWTPVRRVYIEKKNSLNVKSKCARFRLHGKPIHRAELVHDSVFSIVAHYQHEFRGIVEYYRLAYNIHQLNRLKWVMERSLVQTLAHKLRISVRTIYRRYQTTLQTRNGPYVGLQVTVERAEEQKPLIANWGGISMLEKYESSPK